MTDIVDAIVATLEPRDPRARERDLRGVAAAAGQHGVQRDAERVGVADAEQRARASSG